MNRINLIRTAIVILTLLLGIHAIAQEQFTPESKIIIAKVAENLTSNVGISATFTASISKNNNITKFNGELWLKNQKYHYMLNGNEVWFDGKEIWNYITEENEATVSVPDENSNEISPVSIITMYENGFKFKEIEKTAESYTVNLYPEDLTKPYKHIQLTLNTLKNEIKKIESYGNDGTVFTITFLQYKKGLNLTDSNFVFNKAKYPKVQITDLR